MMATSYPFISGSTSKPQEMWIGFPSLHEAKLHAERMNINREKYGQDSTWNLGIWATKPEPWITAPNPAFLPPEPPVRAAVAAPALHRD